MVQSKFKYHLKNSNLITEFEGVCLYDINRQTLEFKESDGTKVLVDLEHLLMTRENDDTVLVLDFNNGNSYIKLKNMNQRMDMPTKITKKELRQNKFMVNYTLNEHNNFEFIIEWNLGGE